MNNEFTIRRPVPSDVEFMLKTWLREMRKSYPRAYPDRLYYNDFQGSVLALTRKADARVICTTNDPNYIVGFVVGNTYGDVDTTVLHFAYIRPPFRRLGLASAALADLGHKPGREIVATHWHPYLDKFDLRKLNLLYNPTVLYAIKD